MASGKRAAEAASTRALAVRIRDEAPGDVAYGRFGFDAALAVPFASPYAGEHFMP